MTKPKVEVTPDHIMRDYRLCWQRKSGGGWGNNIMHKRTHARMQSMLAFLNRIEPEYEYWVEDV